MGNESSKKATSRPTAPANTTHKPAGKGSKHVSINPKDIKESQEKTSPTKKTKTTTPTAGTGDKDGHCKNQHHLLDMDDSAHTFGPASLASKSGHDYTARQNQRRDNTASPVMITDALGDVRANYHIEPKELGHGHYGVVRKCMHRESGQWYAIKSIRKSKVSKIEVLKREIEILKEVKHPHIIELIEVYEDERYLHLITELCTGGELFDRIIAKTQSSEGHFSEHDAAVLVRAILDAIAYCHDEKGIVHRDLKPENFLFLTSADDAPIKIIDFGLSRHDDADLGIMQTKVGTPYYVAPEVLRREYTNSCDIWSIGVITYILLCGYPPFYGDSDTQIFESVKVGKFDFPSPEWDDISPAAKEFVVQLLKKNSTARPTAADALKHRWLKEQLGTVNKNNKERTMSGASISHTSVRTGEFTKYLAMKKLKKAALGYIASNLTQAEVGTLEEIFQSLDQNRTGHITLTELDEAIEKGKFNAQVLQDLRQLRQDLSLADEEQMNYRDFLAATMDRSLAMREDNMKKAFDHFKHSSDAGANHLTLQDLSDIFGGEGHAQEIMTLLDHDGDGKVSYEDFRHAVAESMEDDEDDDQDDDSGFCS